MSVLLNKISGAGNSVVHTSSTTGFAHLVRAASKENEAEKARQVSAQDAIDFAVKLAEDRRALEAEPSSSTIEGPPPRAGPPHYRSSTRTIPRDPLANDESYVRSQLRNNYSSIAFNGIRGLPDAMNPDFRNDLYKSIVGLGRESKAMRNAKATARPTQLASTANGPPLSVPAADVAYFRKPARHSAMSTYFLYPEHIPDGYGLLQELEIAEARKSRAMRYAEEFVVQALPFAPKGTGAFNEFDYMEDPLELAETLLKINTMMDHAKRGPKSWRPAGKASKAEQNKIQLRECLLALSRTLQIDWPESFLQVFEDPSGCIVISFDRETAATEGDVTAYMIQHARTNLTVTEFSLVRDASQWGIIDTETPGVFYIYWPPWAHHRPIITGQLAGLVPKTSRPLHQAHPPHLSNRLPFGQLSDSCRLNNLNTRIFDHAFVTKSNAYNVMS